MAASGARSVTEAEAARDRAADLIHRGRYDEGLTALNAVVATGDPDEAPRALRNIGVLKEDVHGDAEGARSAFEAAIAWNHPLHSQGARVNLAQLLEKEGDRAGAALLFREVIDSDHPVESPRARTLLGAANSTVRPPPFGRLTCSRNPTTW